MRVVVLLRWGLEVGACPLVLEVLVLIVPLLEVSEVAMVLVVELVMSSVVLLATVVVKGVKRSGLMRVAAALQ